VTRAAPASPSPCPPHETEPSERDVRLRLQIHLRLWSRTDSTEHAAPGWRPPPGTGVMPGRAGALFPDPATAPIRPWTTARRLAARARNRAGTACQFGRRVR